MKQKTIITILISLAISAALSYLIVYFRKKKADLTLNSGTAGTNSNSNSNSSGSGTAINTGATGSGYQLPQINNYDWWINKLGHAPFPLKYGSKGVEVVKVQETINSNLKPPYSQIAVDGIWGPETNSVFNTVYPDFNGEISVSQYRIYFDPNNDTKIA